MNFDQYNFIIKTASIMIKKYMCCTYFTSIMILMILLIGSCSSSSHNEQDQLKGKWLRSDGTYTIEILEVNEDGGLKAKYFNPNPINIGRADWQIQKDELQIYVELRDENYPGSIYQLSFDEKTETLQGTYYQAVSRQTFGVKFNKMN